MSASTVIISLSFHLPELSSVNALCNCYLVSSNNLLSSLPPHFLRSENSQIRKHFSITEEQFWNGSVVIVSSEGATVMTEAHSARV